MKFPRTFVATFAIAGLLLFVHVWLPWALGIVVGLGIMALFLGGFAALAITVMADFTGRRRLRIAGLACIGFLVAIAALGWALEILPYIWNGIAALLLFLAVLLLGGLLIWQCASDYLGMLQRRRPPAAPVDWHTLESGELPATDGQHGKERFKQSYELQITCVPRASHHGLSSQPLRMDE
jgi:MFS family permease